MGEPGHFGGCHDNGTSSAGQKPDENKTSVAFFLTTAVNQLTSPASFELCVFGYFFQGPDSMLRLLPRAIAIVLICPFATTADYVLEVLSDSPTGYWRFEETSGTVAVDSSGNGRHGAYVGGYITGQTGLFSGATRFAGGAVELPGSWGGSDALTIEAIVQVTGASGDFQAIVSSDVTNEFAHFQLHSFGNNIVYANPESVFLNNIPIDTGNWRHLVMVAESGDSRLYINGVRVQTDTVPFSIDAILTSNSVSIARGFNGGRHLSGLIDEVAIYDTALPDARVLAHFNAIAGVPEPVSCPLIIAGIGIVAAARRKRRI